MCQQAPSKWKPDWGKDNAHEGGEEEGADEIMLHGPSGAGANAAAEEDKPAPLLKGWSRNDEIESPRAKSHQDDHVMDVVQEQDSAAFACT